MDYFGQFSYIFSNLNIFLKKNYHTHKFMLLINYILLLLFIAIKNFNKNNKIDDEMKIIEKYNELCKYGILLNEKIFQKEFNPKISIISTVYNQEKYILKFLRSIQNQFFDNIEIILIDDYSKDNSVQIIKTIQKEDKRIIIIQHNKNKGILISRNDGILKAKGEYIIIPDCDDILSNDILNKSYILANNYSYDIINFDLYIGNKKKFMNEIIKNIESKPIYQPELSTYIFYGKGHLEQIDVCLHNKLVKKEIYIKSLNSINKYYLNQYMNNWEDNLINYMLFKKANSFYYMKYIGYYYIKNENSITRNYKNKIEDTIRSAFLFLKYIFYNTNNTKFEKRIVECVFNNIYLDISNISYFKNVIKDFHFYYKIIDLYLNNKFISFSIKNKLKDIKNILKNNQKLNA
jgi:glycosyltransferase involved in cell wall biosynthesis